MINIQPRLLILETSGRIGHVATALGNELGAVRTLDESRRHARDLAPAVAAVCAARGWRAKEIEGVIVSRGPGSYTGLRVGLMSAKTLAFAAGCKLLALETFAAIAEQAPRDALRLDVLADAQQQNLYVQRWERDRAGVLHATSPLTIRHVSSWLPALTPEVWVTGPGLKGCETELPAAQPRVSAEFREPLPVSLLTLGFRRWVGGQSDDFWSLEPLYLRPSNAEENWDRRKNA